MVDNSNEYTDEFLKEIIEQPRVWTTLHNGIEIKELKYDIIDEVVKIIKFRVRIKYLPTYLLLFAGKKELYIVEEPLMVGSQIHVDITSVEQYLNLARHWMMDTLSTVAVEKETGNIIGFLICRFNEIALRDDKFSNERIYEGKIWTQLQTFKYFMTKRSDVYKHYNVKKVLEIYSWFVLSSYRGKGIGTELLKNVILRQLPEYEWFKTDVITGVFTGKVSQHIAESLGMKTLYSFIYEKWRINDEDTGESKKFFKETISSNYSAKVMSMKIVDDHAISERSNVNT